MRISHPKYALSKVSHARRSSGIRIGALWLACVVCPCHGFVSAYVSRGYPGYPSVVGMFGAADCQRCIDVAGQVQQLAAHGRPGSAA